MAFSLTAVQVLVSLLLWSDQFTGHQVVAITGGSMEPLMSVGDLVVVSTNVDPRVGDVITFRDARGANVTHRVIDSGPDGLTTQGDANDSADTGLTQPSQVLGVFKAGVSRAGYLVWFMSSTVGRLWTVAMLVLLLLMSEGKKSAGTRRASSAAPRHKHVAEQPDHHEEPHLAA